MWIIASLSPPSPPAVGYPLMPEVFSQIPDDSTQWYLTDTSLDHLKPPPGQYKPNCQTSL